MTWKNGKMFGEGEAVTDPDDAWFKDGKLQKLPS